MEPLRNSPLQASTSSIECPTRLFFDTNPLDQSWPGLSVKIENIFKAAKELKIQIEIPVPVVRELEKHWFGAIQKKYARAKKDIYELFRFAEVTPREQIIPTEQQIKDAYTRRAQRLLSHWSISTTPMPSVSASELFEQANAGELLFDENGHHFKDAIIFHSVVERTEELKERAVIVTDDNRFETKRTELQAYADRRGVSIDFWTASQAETSLTKMLGDKVQAAFEHRKALARKAVEAVLPGIEKTLTENLIRQSRKGGPSNRDFFRDPQMTEIMDVDVTLPETDPKLGFDARISAQILGSLEAVSTGAGQVDVSRGRVPFQVGIAGYGTFDGSSYTIKTMNMSHSWPSHPGAMFTQFRGPVGTI